MKELKQEITLREKRLKKNLLKTLKLLSVTVCVVVIGTTVYQIESQKDLENIVEKYELKDLKFYFEGKEVDIESLKKQQKFYSEFAKGKENKSIQKIKNKNTQYNKNITTKQKKYHRKG